MTEYATMRAGEAMDKAIAACVMGWLVQPCDWTRESWGAAWNALDECGDEPVVLDTPDGLKVGTGAWQLEDGELESWSPSTDIAAAWEVVAKVDTSGRFRLATWSREMRDEEWLAEFRHWHATADTAPLAICRAALLTIEAREESDAD